MRIWDRAVSRESWSWSISLPVRHRVGVEIVCRNRLNYPDSFVRAIIVRAVHTGLGTLEVR